MTISGQMTLEEASTPKLPDAYRSIPVWQVILWVWAITSTLLLFGTLALGAVAWSALEKAGQAAMPFFGEAGCSAYWSFVVDAKQAGIRMDQLEQMYDGLATSSGHAATDACGSIADVYATVP